MRRSKIILVAAIASALLLAVLLLPIDRYVVALVAKMQSLGFAGLLFFAVVYILSAVAMLPGSVLTLAAGFVYGPIGGLALVSPVSVIAATAAFFVGRYAAHDWVERKSSENQRFAAVNKAISRSGFRMVMLLRLSPLFPFNLLNYLLSMTTLRARDFVLASWLGMLPGTAMYVYLGSLVTGVSELTAGAKPSGGPGQSALYFVGLAATLLAAFWITKSAKAGLAAELQR